MVRAIMRFSMLTPACLLIILVLPQEFQQHCAPIIRAFVVQELSRTIGLVNTLTGRLVTRPSLFNSTGHNTFTAYWRCC
jgi:hypothetical protein